MAVKLLFNDIPAFFDSAGDPLSGGKLYTYAAGSTTPQTTYTTSAGDVAQANPIILNSRGEPDNAIWGTSGQTYKFVLKTSADVTIWTIDNVSPINDTTTTIDQWIAGPTPTYIGATQFTLVGDQTSIFHVGRRLKTTNTAGTIYSRISVSAYTTLTTITVVNDSGTLDSGLSAVSYGQLSATNFSIPQLTAANKRLIDLPGLADANTWTGLQTMSGAALNEARSNITQHATTMDFWAAAIGNILDGTGSAVTITACANAPQAGARRKFYPLANTILTHGATFDIDGNQNATAATGDCWEIVAKTVSTYKVHVTKDDGTAVVSATAATQADQETATSTTTYVSPGRQQYHPSAAKMWAYVARGAGTPSLSSPSYNVTSLTDEGVAQTRVNLTTSFSSGVYSPTAAACNTTQASFAAVGIDGLSAASFAVKIWGDDGSARDTTDFTCSAFGDQ